MNDDLISRQAVLDLVVANHTELNGLNVVMYSPLYKDIKQLQPVNPQEPKTGHWIAHPEIETSTPEYLMFYECSECGDNNVFAKQTFIKRDFVLIAVQEWQKVRKHGKV